MSRRNSFHFRQVAASPSLQLLRDILMAANGPMSQGDVQLEVQRRGTLLLNVSTLINEIGQNHGYQVSEGMNYGQKKGPAVRFPDGKYRYWLVAAPGWRQSWTVTRDYRVVPAGQGYNSITAETAPAALPVHAPEADRAEQENDELESNINHCKACGKEIPDGPPFCNDECKSEVFGKG